MNLKNYIEWTETVDEYKVSLELADKHAWGFKSMNNVRFPKFNLDDPTDGGEGYHSVRNERITQWARMVWPELSCIEAKIQIQKPGEECSPHLDLVGEYLRGVCDTLPGLLKVAHTLKQPGVDLWRLFVATEDHVDGQIFNINDVQWKWQKGDCIRLNNWQALHWTKNDSDTDRIILKITGIKT